jgi:pSer/pThr/pTyr-binding forkhead associated (FHA) protein/tetratricopeptide (TPR) repeat protein
VSDDRHVFVIVRAPNGDVREFPVGEGASVIGRDDSCDIRVDDRKVSRRHAAFRLIDGQPWAEDLGSVNGIRLNGKKINQRAMMLDGDVVQVGGYEVRLKPVTRAAVKARRSDTPAPSDTMGMRVAPPDTARARDDGVARLTLFGQTKPVAGRRFPLGFGESIVGRLEDCAVPILDGSVSRQHARIVLSADAATVTDLGSSNGVFVNEVRIDRAELTDGDRLKFGSVDFRVELSSEIPSRVGPLEPSRVGRVPIKPRRAGGGRAWALGGAGVFVLALVVVLAGHSLGRWRVPGLPARPVGAGLEPVADPVADPAVDPAVDPVAARSPTPTEAPLASAGPSPSALAGAASTAPEATTAPSVAPDPEASPMASASPSATASPSASVEPLASAVPSPRPQATSPAAVATPAATAPPAGAAVTPSALAIRTSTSPYGPRDVQGLPTDVPNVDVGFDFEGFVAAYLARATELELAGRFPEMRQVLAELMARDPINRDARALSRRADVAEKASKLIDEGDAERGAGRGMRALEMYAAVPSNTSMAAKAQQRIAELKPAAIKRELETVELMLKREKLWPQAHGRYCRILAIDPQNGEVAKAREALEGDMRGRGVEPPPCGSAASVDDEAEGTPTTAPGSPGSPGAGTPGPTPPGTPGAPATAPPTLAPAAKSEAINQMWPDRTLQRIVLAYADGDLAGSVKRAELAARKAKGAARGPSKDLLGHLKRAQAKYERVKNEVSNDPSVAWAQLLELARIELDILPAGVKSFLVLELERTIAEAFAERGAQAYEQERYDHAFTLWDAGLRLNAGNGKIQQGLVRLEQLAEKWAKEAELAAQRGQPDACDRWRSITRMTRSNHDAHKKARAALQRGC